MHKLRVQQSHRLQHAMRGALMLLLAVRRAHAFARHAAVARRRIKVAAKPALVVWDMDDCLWSPEMFTLSEMPSDPVRGDLNGRGEGVIGVRSGSDVIRLFPDALRVCRSFGMATTTRRSSRWPPRRTRHLRQRSRRRR